MEVDFRNKIFCLHPKNLDSVIGFASDLLCNLGQVCKLNREDWWMAWAYRLGKSGSSWPDQGICFKPFESAWPESGIGFWNSQGKASLQQSRSLREKQLWQCWEGCSTLPQQLAWQRSWAVPCTAITVSSQLLELWVSCAGGEKAFLEIKFRVRSIT